VKLNNIFFDGLLQDTVYCYSVNGPVNRSHTDYITHYALTRGSGLIAYRLDPADSNDYGPGYVFLKIFRKQMKRKALVRYWEEKFSTPQ